MPDIEIDGRRIHYRSWGDPGRPLLVLVHGLQGDGSTVASLATRLAAPGDLHVVAPDAIGHGRSERPVAFTLRDQGAMVDHLVTALGAEAGILVGISMGSYIVAQAAILEPARASHLVLVVSKPNGLTSSSAAFAARRGVDLATLSPEEGLALLQEAMWSPSTPAARRAEIMAELAGEQLPLSRAEQAAIEASVAGFDLRPELATITARTLVVSGEYDGLNPPELGRELADGIPGATFRVYDAGHALASERGEELAADIRRLIAEH